MARLLEPISPELVLVDPELARAERARLVERARLAELALLDQSRRATAVDPVAEPVAQQPEAAPSASPDAAGRREWVAPRLSAVGLLASGFLFAVFVVGSGQTAPFASRIARPTTTRSAAPATVRSPTSRQTRRVETSRTTTAVVAERTRPAVHRSPTNKVRAPDRRASAIVTAKVLSIVLTTPRSKLPKRLIDPKTGLAKTNLQAVCRPSAVNGSFLCVLRLPRDRPTVALHALYRPSAHGRGALRWYPLGHG